MFFLRALPVFLILHSAVGWAGEIYLCTRADGERIFKSFPCREGEQSQQIPAFPARKATAVSFQKMAGGPLEVPLLHTSRPGRYWIEVKLNTTVTSPFLIDTGATDLLIPEELFEELKRNGITAQDHVGRAKLTIADGSTMETQSIHLHQFSIGGREIEHLVASIGNRGTTPLLGANILERFGKWHIDPGKNRLVLEGTEGENPKERDDLTTGRCLEKHTFIHRSIGRIDAMHEAHQRSAEKLKAQRQKAEAEPNIFVKNGLIGQYNADVAIHNKTSQEYKAQIEQWTVEMKAQENFFNTHCPGRVYQEENGHWKSFYNIKLQPK